MLPVSVKNRTRRLWNPKFILPNATNKYDKNYQNWAQDAPKSIPGGLKKKINSKSNPEVLRVAEELKS